MSIIELSKLFNENPNRDRFNIFHFISKLIKDRHFGDMNVDESKIKEWESELENNKIKINHVITLRDKLYSHTDPNWQKYTSIYLKLSDIQDLINILEKVIKEIYSAVFDSGTDMSTPSFDKRRLNNIFKTLAGEKRRKNEETLSFINKSKS